MSRLAADCFAVAGRLQYTSFQTNSVDLNDALLVSIHGWKDAGSRELYIYDQVHMNGPPEMGRHFWGHLPLSWMHEPMLDFTLYYILFSNEEAGDDANPLWVVVLKDTRRQRPHRWTWQLLTTKTVLMHKQCRSAMAANAEGICARANVFQKQTLRHILSFHATSAASWYRPLLGSSLWELEGLRTEWHMSATGAN